jgi:hypothetical protein
MHLLTLKRLCVQHWQIHRGTHRELEVKDDDVLLLSGGLLMLAPKLLKVLQEAATTAEQSPQQG